MWHLVAVVEGTQPGNSCWADGWRRICVHYFTDLTWNHMIVNFEYLLVFIHRWKQLKQRLSSEISRLHLGGLNLCWCINESTWFNAMTDPNCIFPNHFTFTNLQSSIISHSASTVNPSNSAAGLLPSQEVFNSTPAIFHILWYCN